jgi:predicted Zn-dependent protease
MAVEKPGGVLRRALAAAVLVVAAACATNPATGRRDLMLIGEGQEIALGKQEDAKAVAAYGTYPDDALARWVESLGLALAARSERPTLPWSFRLADDAAVNAFAAPGGFIFVTRGILAHLDSEAELAMVMGHEVGHVTGRHLARQLSQQQLATLGLGVGMIAVPELQRYAGLGQTGLGLLFLKFGRDDEREADDLGLRYAQRLEYDLAQGARAFRMLDLLARQEPGGRMPSWLSTHPDPGDRYRRLLAAIEPAQLRGGRVERESYLRRLEGMTFGENPREGFFRDGAFYHPDLRFRLQVPRGFQTRNTKQAVLAASREGDAVFQLTLARDRSAEAAARAFFRDSGLRAVDARRTGLNGLQAVAGGFEGVSGQTRISGAAAFVEHEGRVFQLVGYAGAYDWPRYRTLLAGAIGSFSPLRERWALEAQPRRVSVVALDRDMTLAEFTRRYPSTVPDATIALVNQLEPGDTLAAGRLVKRVAGGESWQQSDSAGPGDGLSRAFADWRKTWPSPR